jgi:hypothetical protein
MRAFHLFTQRSKERGIYFILVAIFGLGLLGLTALVIQLGLVAVAQNRLQLVVNLAALSAIEQYVRFSPAEGDSAPEISRRSTTEERVNTILQSNSVWGLDPSKFNVTQSLSGESRILYGRWHRSDPDGPGGVSCGKYPCFVQSADAVTSGNAIRIVVQNESNNPFARFIGSVFGPDTFTVRGEATATLVKRCMAFLVDLSLSSTGDTHVLPQPGAAPSWRDGNPAFDVLRESVGFFADTEESRMVEVVQDPLAEPPYFPGGPFPLPVPAHLGLFAFVNPPPACDYATLMPPNGGINYAALYWCSLMIREDLTTVPELSTTGQGYHFRDQYREVPTAFNQNRIFIDLVTRPEPFSTFLLAFNAGLRMVYKESSNADEAMFAGFSKDIHLSGVNRRFPQLGLTRNIPFLVHLTNIDNIGRLGSAGEVVDADPPSILDLGIFPIFAQNADATATNLPGVLDEVIGLLDASCGPSDRKMIVLASDGISNCIRYGQNPTSCSGTFLGYINSEQQLLNPVNGTIRRLIDRQVALTVLHSGSGVRPNFKRIPTVCPNGVNDCLLDFDGALPAGRTSGLVYSNELGVFCNDPFNPESTSFINCSSLPPQAGSECVSPAGASSWTSGCEFEAFRNIGGDGVYFGRAAALMAELALRSGGRYCPLLPPLGAVDIANPNYLDHDNDEPPDSAALCQNCTPRRLKASAIPSSGTVDYALELRSPGEQAADCARLAVGGNPFMLVEE